MIPPDSMKKVWHLELMSPWRFMVGCSYVFQPILILPETKKALGKIAEFGTQRFQ